MLPALAALRTLIALAAANLVFAIYLTRKIKNMSDAAFQKLTADTLALKAENEALTTAAAAKDAEILDLKNQLAAAQAAAGTSDADVLALDAQIAGAPPAPPVEPAPEAPPVG